MGYRASKPTAKKTSATASTTSFTWPQHVTQGSSLPVPDKVSNSTTQGATSSTVPWCAPLSRRLAVARAPLCCEPFMHRKVARASLLWCGRAEIMRLSFHARTSFLVSADTTRARYVLRSSGGEMVGVEVAPQEQLGAIYNPTHSWVRCCWDMRLVEPQHCMR